VESYLARIVSPVTRRSVAGWPCAGTSGDYRALGRAESRRGAGLCPPPLQDLAKIPTIDAVGHKLKGTILLTDQQEWVSFRRSPTATPGASGATQTCYVQYMRVYHAGLALNHTTAMPDPLPGPTLRARIGNIIELTFLNQINPADFGASIDQDIIAAAHVGGHMGMAGMPEPTGSGCDQTNRIYPRLIVGPPKSQDVLFDHFPDCFHGSSTGNIHFHGTHTNPDGTGDNVLIQVRPSNPQQDGAPAVTADAVRRPFEIFYKDCEAHFAAGLLVEWPKVWDDLPAAFTKDQETRLKAYDARHNRALWPADKQAKRDGVWPEFCAYPYCFQLPRYTETTYPPPASDRPVFGAPAVILIKDVDGVYEADPKLHPDAGFIPEISAAALISMRLPTLPIEPVVLELLTRAKLVKSVRVIDGLVPGNLTKALAGEPVGTLIHS
jgi:hypothetical protein